MVRIEGRGGSILFHIARSSVRRTDDVVESSPRQFIEVMPQADISRMSF